MVIKKNVLSPVMTSSLTGQTRALRMQCARVVTAPQPAALTGLYRGGSKVLTRSNVCVYEAPCLN